MFSNSTFWVGVAFFIFMGLAWRMGAFRSMLDALDRRSGLVRDELAEAQRLRTEADALLVEYKRRREEAEREAQDIVSSAREEAERVAREAQERMTEFVRRRTAAAEAKISQAEASAAAQVRAAAADAAVRISEAVLREDIRGPAAESLLARSLGEVKGKLHS